MEQKEGIHQAAKLDSGANNPVTHVRSYAENRIEKIQTKNLEIKWQHALDPPE